MSCTSRSPSGQRAEEKRAVRVGRRGRQQERAGGGVAQLDHHARQTRLAHVLHAVAVDVEPHAIAEFELSHKAEIVRRVVDTEI